MNIIKLQYNIIARFLIMVATASIAQVSAADKPIIVTSIKPLAIIAKSAVADAAQVEYLLPANQSPHNFIMPVSALKKIARADLVIWIGPAFETRSAKMMAKLPDSKLITAMQLPLAVHAAKPKPAKSISRHGHSMEADPHVWLNPEHGNQIAAAIQARLGLPIKEIISPQNIAELRAELASAGEKTYLSHHEAYGHFVAAFGLKPGLSIRDGSGGVQGVKTQYQLRMNIEKANASCVFFEPQYQDKDAAIIAAEFHLPLVPLDSQGLAQTINSRAYSEFLTKLVAQFKACFK